MQHYRDAFFAPRIGIRQGFEQWDAAGGKDALARAGIRFRELLDGYREPSMDSRRRAQLEAFVERRSRELL